MVNVLLFIYCNMLAIALPRAALSLAAMPRDDAKPPPKPPSQEAAAIGRALRGLRKQRQMTQPEAAAAAGVTKTAWQNYENGRSVILRTDVQARLAAALGATREDLLFHLAVITPHGERASLSGLSEPPARYDDMRRPQAIFPLREGDVTLTLPSDLSDESFDQLAQYLCLFLKARRPTN